MPGFKDLRKEVQKMEYHFEFRFNFELPKEDDEKAFLFLCQLEEYLRREPDAPYFIDGREENTPKKNEKYAFINV